MKILIYGSKGWIGGLFKNYLDLIKIAEVVEGTERLDSDTLIDEILKVYPTHIISFTGRTHGVIDDKLVNSIDYLEYPGKLVENIRDNLYSPVILADICNEYSIHYTYIGTGCIFNGPVDELFTEDSLPNYFGSSYSIVKGFTDRLMQDRDILNLRIRMPISSIKNDRNFITKIVKYDKICSLPNSMTVLDDFFPIFMDLMIKRKTGTYNCTNPGVISHNEILTRYMELVDNTITWTNMTLEEQKGLLKSDRSNNHLDTSLIESEYPDLLDIHKSVNRILINYSHR